MAGSKQWQGGKLGVFHLGRRFKGVKLDADLGRLYEARNMRTGRSALVLMPDRSSDWEPEESWQVRASSHTAPAFLALEVEHAPASGRLSAPAEMLDLLTSVLEQVEKNPEVRAHLLREPVGRLKLWLGRWRRRLRSRRGLAVVGLALVGLGVVALGLLWPRAPQQAEGQEHTHHGVALEALSQVDAPSFADKYNPSAAPIAYPIPEKPFKSQAKAPCKLDEDEVEINGGCWVELARRPPCAKSQAEHKGKCYLPVRDQRVPQSLQP